MFLMYIISPDHHEICLVQLMIFFIPVSQMRDMRPERSSDQYKATQSQGGGPRV